MISTSKKAVPIRRRSFRMLFPGLPDCLIALCLVAAPACFFCGCSSVFFYPTREYIATPDQLGLRYETVKLKAGKHPVELEGWWLPAAGESCATVLLFHGNAQNMSNHLFGVSWLPAAGFNLLIYDYRGYGRSAGEPVTSALVADGEVVINEALRRSAGKPLIVYGQSLGGALAVPIVAASANRSRIAAIVLESAFLGYPAIVREKLNRFYLTWPFQYPLSWLFLSRFDPIDHIARLPSIPILFIHGEKDDIVFTENSRLLYNAANEPKELWVFADAGHISSLQFPAYRKKLIQYLRNRMSCTESPAAAIK